MKNHEINKLLHLVHDRLKSSHGDLVKQVILFGSRVAGGYRSYSDYDFLIILSEDVDWRGRDEILNSVADINLEEDIIIDAHFITENELLSIKGKQPYIQNALDTGIAV